ncbi:phosphatases II [Coprinopsis marcescibilis]|uniref:protein-tyrosine-phosphatase n=1 Tax=Coprinopsis marcescibilis TaxID=230819 RepID=A0A5C3KUK7_COPMA|nr:phosphatases II [Coprinopsis marcescibilis]
MAITNRNGAEASITDVVDGQLYLGNLAAAKDPILLASLGITHILSVCPDYPSTGANHHVIAVDDNEYEDILVHLGKACAFVQDAVDANGRVLVHCVMGVSRSVTVVAAYLMKTRKMGVQEVLCLLKQRRPQVHPNYGFIKQLESFEKCKYGPTPVHPAYRSWKRKHVQDVTCYLNRLEDIAAIVPDRLMLMSEFPEDRQQGHSLLMNIGITHLVTLSPVDMSCVPCEYGKTTHHVEVSEQDPDSVLDFLPDAVGFMARAIAQDGRVLIFSENEPRACIAACAYLIATRKISSSEALSIIEKELLLFSPPQNWLERLKKLDEKSYRETLEHGITTIMTTATDHMISPDNASVTVYDGASLAIPPPLHKVNPEKHFAMDEVKDALISIQEKGIESPVFTSVNIVPAVLS